MAAISRLSTQLAHLVKSEPAGGGGGGGGGGLACVGLSGSAGRMLRAIKAWLLPGATEHKCANTVHASLGSQ